MSSVAEQIAEAIFDALYNTIPAVGVRVFRARQDAVRPEECPAITVDTGIEDAALATLDGAFERCDLTINVGVHVSAGDVWETEADTVSVATHAAVAGAVLPGNATNISSHLTSRDAQSADQTPGVLVHSYTVTYYRSFAALDVAA